MQQKDCGDGILRFTCPSCGYVFRYRRGRVKNPTIKEIDEYLTRAQCRECGKLINARMKREADRVREIKMRIQRRKTADNCVKR